MMTGNGAPDLVPGYVIVTEYKLPSTFMVVLYALNVVSIASQSTLGVHRVSKMIVRIMSTGA